MLRILHTSDWHLGQNFHNLSREAEHRLALDWLLRVIKDHAVDILLVAGDIFDVGNPPAYAQKLYFQFLTQLITTPCRHIVIIGGNHDSPSSLSATKELLQVLNIHVIGAATNSIEDEIVALKNGDGDIEAVIAAVPFLRDRDLRQSVSGESGAERIDRIKEGIYQHYKAAEKAVQKYAKQKIPLIATGHLYAKGASSGKSDNNKDIIYIGNMENIEAAQFPAIFDYIALGHLHRAQRVGGTEHIRYSGSLIPLDFGEIQDTKTVLVVDFDGRKLKDIQSVKVPVFRQLVKIKGSVEDIKKKLIQLAAETENEMEAWVDVRIESESVQPNVDMELRTFCADMPLQLLKVRTISQQKALDAQTMAESLDELSPLEVFRKRCESAGELPEDMAKLEAAFLEIIKLVLEL